MRLFAVSAPLLFMFLFLGWNVLTAGYPADEGSGLVANAGESEDSNVPEEPSTPASAATLPQTASGDENDWNLVLVNPWNPISGEQEITLTKLKNGHEVDERCYPDLQEMMDDCRKNGLSPVICSSYRTQRKQEQLFQNKVNSFLAKGYSAADAQEEAGKIVAVPGTSEHQLGLAIDIVDVNNQRLDSSQEETKVQQWLMKNSWKYGFVLRYPSEKSEITGIVYEPWHYRYVGKEAAQYLHENEICLEEYLDLLA